MLVIESVKPGDQSGDHLDDQPDGDHQGAHPRKRKQKLIS